MNGRKQPSYFITILRYNSKVPFDFCAVFETSKSCRSGFSAPSRPTQTKEVNEQSALLKKRPYDKLTARHVLNNSTVKLVYVKRVRVSNHGSQAMNYRRYSVIGAPVDCRQWPLNDPTCNYQRLSTGASLRRRRQLSGEYLPPQQLQSRVRGQRSHSSRLDYRHSL